MFKTGFVLHYVSEYSLLEIDKIKKVTNPFRQQSELVPALKNESTFDVVVENLPIGTIICKNLSSNVDEFVICLPMFSSHLSLPVKKGEVIWFFTNNDKTFKAPVEESSPLLSVRNYWVSRKIGLKTSEDLNYTYFLRDNKISDETTGNSNFTLPDFTSSKIFNSIYNEILPSSIENYRKSKQEEYFYPAAVPRWYSKPYELTLQGSNNSIINLTNSKIEDKNFYNKGAIDIVSGRHLIRDFETNNRQNSVSIRKTPENFDLRIKSDLSTNSYLKIQNTEGDLELCKNQKMILSDDINYIDESPEGKISKFNDASRIYISEYDNLDKDYYKSDFLKGQHILSKDFKKAETYSAAFLFTGNSGSDLDKNSKEENVVFNNIEINTIDLRKVPVPSIFIKSNDIRIVARKKYQNSDNLSLPSGSIRLIKESNDAQNYSHLCLEEDGQIAIDGKSILLGNFNKEYERFLLKESRNIENAEGMHGNGNGVLIGYEPNLSEPLVLGDSLISIVKELIHINIDLVEQVKKLSEDITNHSHSGVMSGGGITLPTSKNPVTQKTTKNANNFANLPVDPLSKSGDQNHEVLTKRYKNLQNNLYKVLSRFAKTS